LTSIINNSILYTNSDVTVVNTGPRISIFLLRLVIYREAIGSRLIFTSEGMKYGAGTIAANKAGADHIVDPRPYTVGTITDTFNKYPDIGPVLPAMGYSDQQVHDLEQTINRTKCDAVVIGTPIDLTRIININKPATRVRYEIKEIGELSLVQVIDEFIKRVDI